MKGTQVRNHSQSAIAPLESLMNQALVEQKQVNFNGILIRVFDVVVAATLLILLSPLLLLFALLIKVTSPGPIFYHAQRIGKEGQLFYLLKFRSMVVGADKGTAVTLKNDARITPIGRWLRRTKLDELPQLWNVLTGEMALVGPRPEAPRYVELYTPQERAVLTVRPGITSAASICYRHEEQLLHGEEWETTYINKVMREKLAIDLAYLEKHSFAGVLNILLHTVLAIFNYEPTVRQSEEAPQALAELLKHAEAPSRWRRFFATRLRHALVDGSLVVLSLWVALFLRFEGAVPSREALALAYATPLAVVVYLVAIRQAKIYRFLWQYAGAREVWRIGVAAIGGMIVLILLDLLYPAPERPIPLSVFLIGGVFIAGGLTVIRYRGRLLTGAMGYIQPVVGGPNRQRVLIIGAGRAAMGVGEKLSRQLMDYEMVGYIDDDPRKHGLWSRGGEVLGGREKIESVVKERDVSLIVLAIHHILPADFHAILGICQRTTAQLLILPHHSSEPTLLQPEHLLAAQELEIAPVVPSFWHRKRVLITGSTTFIGKELARLLSVIGVAQLVLLDTNEAGLFQLQIVKEAERVLANVCDEKRIGTLLADYQPEVIFHTAAYTQPKTEQNLREVVLLNVGGTATMVRLAASAGVRHFIHVLTHDSHTARLAEQIVQAHHSPSTRCTTVRTEHLFNQPGGIVWRWLKQIEQGSPVKINSSERVGRFILVRDAARALLHLPLLPGGRYVTTIGEEIDGLEFAQRLIRMRGNQPGKESAIEVSEGETTTPIDKKPTDFPFLHRVEGGNRLIDSSALTSLLDAATNGSNSKELLALLQKAAP